MISRNKLRAADFAEKEIDVVLRIRVFSADCRLIFAVKQIQIFQFPLRIRPVRNAPRNLRKLVRTAVELLHLGNEIVHKFDEGVFFLESFEDLELLALFCRNRRQNHMSAVFVYKSPLASSQLLKQPIAEPRQGKHLNVHQCPGAGMRNQFALRLQCKLVGNHQQRPTSDIVIYELLFVEVLPTIKNVQHISPHQNSGVFAPRTAPGRYASANTAIKSSGFAIS